MRIITRQIRRALLIASVSVLVPPGFFLNLHLFASSFIYEAASLDKISITFGGRAVHKRAANECKHTFSLSIYNRLVLCIVCTCLSYLL